MKTLLTLLALTVPAAAQITLDPGGTLHGEEVNRLDYIGRPAEYQRRNEQQWYREQQRVFDQMRANEQHEEVMDAIRSLRDDIDR